VKKSYIACEGIILIPPKPTTDQKKYLRSLKKEWGYKNLSCDTTKGTLGDTAKITRPGENKGAKKCILRIGMREDFLQ